ncbi:glycerophosphoryl diester phosphodiesterase membrane domain-containing protein [Actinomyces howellii]|uniref:DUF7847 domain-containing protein n=1 Tax=Actinomyces howellii TaxID=52771 RepID=A0A3S4RCD0_9ACTO|nr:glycerophosphoryl diester phosphodiesterase membrane domain-containing protein [Actinomyces howellii]VEG29927.1 Uncharacterised protein [Actinomyces howellii]
MSDHSNGWLPPTEQSTGPQDRAVPRYGAYDQAPAGQYGQDHQQGQYGQYGQHGQYGAGAGSYGLPTGGFALAPKPGIVPLRALGVMEIISGAFDAIRANPRAMLLPSLLIMTLTGLVSAGISYAATEATASTLDDLASSDGQVPLDTFLGGTGGMLGTIATTVLTILAGVVLTGVLIMAVSRSVLGRIATPSEIWRRTRSRIWALLGQTLLIGLMNGLVIVVTLGTATYVGFRLIDSSASYSGASIAATLIIVFLLMLAALIGSLYLTTRLWLASCALILENIGVWEGIQRSWTLTRRHFWRVLGILLLANLITTALVGVASSAVGGLGSIVLVAVPNGMALYMALSNFLTSLLQAAVLPFTAAVTALTYIDLRMRDEGLDVELRQAADS